MNCFLKSIDYDIWYIIMNGDIFLYKHSTYINKKENYMRIRSGKTKTKQLEYRATKKTTRTYDL